MTPCRIRTDPGALTGILCTLALFAGPLAAECTLKGNRDDFFARESQLRQKLFDRIDKFRAGSATPRSSVDANEIPRRNFIDEAIFENLAKRKVPSARITTDAEFVRRIYFDLTGHPPTPAEFRAFVEDTNVDKRNLLIDKLLYSDRFVDKWTIWWGDLLQNVAFPSNFDRWYPGRDAYYQWMRKQVAHLKSIRETAWEAVTGKGNNYNVDEGGANWAMNGIVAMGPVQDRYDNMLVQNATAFLGVAAYDCLLCHNGRGRLDGINLWGMRGTRVEAQQMAAFFARMSWVRPGRPTTDFYYRSMEVSDRASGNYDLNTNFGNRPNREPVGESRFFTPEYRDGRKPEDGNWRVAFANFMVDDRMFSINFANRIWKEMFGLALVDPVDSLDPARLDPSNPPPAPWTLQASHPELLVRLADELAGRNFSLREFLRLLAESSAYQLSSRYDAPWDLTKINLYARHYPRRLEGEELHDSIVKASGNEVSYKVESLDATVWALQMPDPNEPRVNGQANNFMRPFYRGNRDAFFRIQDGSILQQLALMNDPFVTGRIKMNVSPTLRAAAQLGDSEAVDEIFLLYLNRMPDEREKKIALDFLAQAGSQRNTYLEDLVWTLINKVDFLYNY